MHLKLTISCEIFNEVIDCNLLQIDFIKIDIMKLITIDIR